MARTPVTLQCMVPGERRTVLSTVDSVQVCQHLQPLAWTSTLTVRATSQTSVQTQTTTNGWEITVGNSVEFVDLDEVTDIHNTHRHLEWDVEEACRTSANNLLFYLVLIFLY